MFSDHNFNSMQIKMTYHAKLRSKQRNIDENDLENCLRKGATSLGHYNEQYQSTPYIKTHTLRKGGKYVETIVVYELLEKNVDEDVLKVITMYRKMGRLWT